MSKKSKLIFFAITLSLIVLNTLWVIQSYSQSGYDYESYQAAVKALKSGENPYIAENLKQYSKNEHSYNYPPIFLFMFRYMFLFGNKVEYYIIWSLLLLAICFLLRRIDAFFNAPLFLCLLLTGFISIYWNFTTGNIGIILLFLMSLFLYFLYNNKDFLFSLTIGVFSSFKILPFALIFPYLMLKIPLNRKIKVLSISLASFSSVILLSYVIFKDIFPSYILQISGNIANQHSPLHESWSITNPSLFLLIQEILVHLRIYQSYWLYFIYLLICSIIIFCYFYLLKRHSFNDYEKIYVGILLLLVIIPRLKPYDYTLAIIPTYFLLKKLNMKERIISILIISVLPLILTYSYGYLRSFYLRVIFAFIQPLSLILFLIYFSLVIIKMKSPKGTLNALELNG